ncbi:hypothetical protein ZIOFF_009269 [Zingiber officinale]|uniref:Uncharacterized protein n=1 Tax=Zingiber officinale TaxID=94328 RepID=A0A8J5HMQ0_ZINOF|nr:hypothetical protein ZIOFF_009269 [Zingiber officinale]
MIFSLSFFFANLKLSLPAAITFPLRSTTRSSSIADKEVADKEVGDKAVRKRLLERRECCPHLASSATPSHHPRPSFLRHSSRRPHLASSATPPPTHHHHPILQLLVYIKSTVSFKICVFIGDSIGCKLGSSCARGLLP